MRPYIVLILALLLISCSGSNTYIDSEKRNWKNQAPPPGDDVIYQVFLIGDAGSPSLDVQEPNLKLFEKFLSEAGERSAAVFLGDNIYLNGLPDSTHPRRSFYEARINEQLKTVENFKGRVIFLPGNHDWDDGGKDGLAAINRQEDYIESYLDRGNTFQPDNGYPGPVEIKLMDEDDDPRLRHDIRFVALDTQWWLHEYEKPYGDTGEYELTDAGDVLTELEDIIRDRRNDFLIIGAHHPLISNDTHGGYFPAKTHFKPPVFGSLYALYRKVFGLEQDLAHHRYKKMIHSLKETFKEKEEIIYVSGHGHTLQYHRKVRSWRYLENYIVSGAGTKAGFVAKGRGAEFTHKGNGFMKLKFYANGSVWMEAWQPLGNGSEGKLLYRTQIQDSYGDPLSEAEEELPDIDYSDSTVVVAPYPEYDNKGKLHRAIMGSNKRELWAIKAEFPVFDVTEVEGGLTPVRSGGKGQSNSLHLDGKDGKEYVLRSVNKEAGKVWDDALKESFALDVAQDQYSMLDPYAALIVARLSEAAGVYHMNPKIYYVPDDPLLGTFGDEMAGSLALFERKPDNDMSDMAGVNYAEDVISHADMIREVDGDIDHRVDQKLFARSRLFDMLISDWDRHYDQWRWAAVEPEDRQGKIYKPVPRDRDVAFMKLNGIGPTLAKLGPFFQYQSFSDHYNDLKAINYNSLDLTRRFTNQLSKEDWISIAEEISDHLTDEVITEAAQQYPVPVYEKAGKELEETLKIRRDRLVEAAENYYDLINDVVSIPASHKRELIKIEILSPEQVRVRINKMSGKCKIRENYYERTFTSKETGEIRIFGMGGEDRFEISGKERNKIRIRIIGGSGKDDFLDESPLVNRKMVIYDSPDGNTFTTGKGTALKFVDDPMENRYNYRSEYHWNSVAAGLYFSFNDDDGIFFGGGPRFTRYGFRKNPAQQHFLRANYAPLTGAANFRYNGSWYDLFNEWDGHLKGNFLLPESYRYFFGLGNETDRSQRRSSNYYRARLSQYEALGEFSRSLNNIVTYSVGGGVLFTRVDDVTGEQSVLTNPQLGLNPNIFSNQWYTLVESGIQFSDLSHGANPRQGAKLALHSDFNIGMNEGSETHTRISSSLEVYLSAQTSRQLTFANRTGGDHNFGSFPFYQSNTIGGHRNLRGFNNRRFSGRTTFYNNSELRFELFNFYKYYLGGRGGALTFFDIGRVWTDGEQSSVWHKGAGGGIWFNVFDSFLFSVNVGKSSEDISIEIKSGFFF